MDAAYRHNVPVTFSVIPYEGKDSNDAGAWNLDVLNFSWREYGLRVGIWRMMEVMEKHNVRATVALNSDICEHCPEIIKAGNTLGWEWMGHGQNNATFFDKQSEEEERAIMRGTLDAIEKHSGKRPKGWLSPGLTETFNTPDILAEEGIEYVANWVNDDQPYPMKTRKNQLISIPYSLEIGDIPAFLEMKQSAEEFYKMMVDEFDVLYQEGAKSGRVMAMGLHPFLIGRAFRCKYFDMALEYITKHDHVWVATGNEIVGWYREKYLRS